MDYVNQVAIDCAESVLSDSSSETSYSSMKRKKSNWKLFCNFCKMRNHDSSMCKFLKSKLEKEKTNKLKNEETNMAKNCFDSIKQGMNLSINEFDLNLNLNLNLGISSRTSTLSPVAVPFVSSQQEFQQHQYQQRQQPKQNEYYDSNKIATEYLLKSIINYIIVFYNVNTNTELVYKKFNNYEMFKNGDTKFKIIFAVSFLINYYKVPVNIEDIFNWYK